MSNYRCTPISIDTSDTTEYLGTKFNLASTILQSTTKNWKVLDSLMFLVSFHLVDQNKVLSESKITMPEYRCASLYTHQEPTIGRGYEN